MSDDNDFEDLLDGLDAPKTVPQAKTLNSSPPSDPQEPEEAVPKASQRSPKAPPRTASKADAKDIVIVSRYTTDIDWGNDLFDGVSLDDLFGGDNGPTKGPQSSNTSKEPPKQEAVKKQGSSMLDDILGNGESKRPPIGDKRPEPSKSYEKPSISVTLENDSAPARKLSAPGGYQPSKAGKSTGGLRRKALGAGGSVTFGETSVHESDGGSERKALTFTENPLSKKDRPSLEDLLQPEAPKSSSGIADWLSGDDKKISTAGDDWMNIARPRKNSIGGSSARSATSARSGTSGAVAPAKVDTASRSTSRDRNPSGNADLFGEEIPLDQILSQNKSSKPSNAERSRSPVTPTKLPDQHYETPVSKPSQHLALPSNQRPAASAPSQQREDDVISMLSGNASSVRNSEPSYSLNVTAVDDNSRGRKLSSRRQTEVSPSPDNRGDQSYFQTVSRTDQRKEYWEDEKEYLIQKYESKIQYLKDWQNEQSKRAAEEKEAITAHYKSLLELVEKDRVELIARHDRNLQDMESRHQQAISQLRQLHEKSFDEARAEFDRKLESLNRQKEAEIEAIKTASSHFKSVNVVVEQLESQAKTISELSYSVGNKNSSTLDAREFQVRAKENEMRILEERLQRQMEDTESERRKMQELVTKMEVHMRENLQSIEQDKYNLIQDQARLSAERKSLNLQHQEMNEKIATERALLDKAKQDFEREQNEQRSLLYEERRIIGIEKAKLDASLKSYTDREKHESMKSAQSEAEITGTLKAIAQEHQELAKTSAQLKVERDQIEKDKMALEEAKKRFEIERRALDESLMENKNRKFQLEQLAADAKKIREEGLEALSKATAIELEENHRLQSIKNQLTSLRSQEQSLAQERLLLAQQQKSLEAKKETMLCSKCSEPAFTGGFSMKPAGYAPMEVYGARDMMRTSLDSGFNTPADFNAHISQAAVTDMLRHALEVDNQLQELKRAAESDKEYLEGESEWLTRISQEY